MSKHTKTPWKYLLNSKPHNDMFPVIGPDGYCVAWLPDVMDERDANARLIAAAPELIECLKAVVQNWPLLNEEHFSGPAKKLRRLSEQAIAKAEGRNK